MEACNTTVPSTRAVRANDGYTGAVLEIALPSITLPETLSVLGASGAAVTLGEPFDPNTPAAPEFPPIPSMPAAPNPEVGAASLPPVDLLILICDLAFS